MNGFRRPLKWGFFSTMVLLVALVAAWAVSRAVYPTGEQRNAMAEMERSPDHGGENAFALLWTLDRDVPHDELDAVMSEDARRYAEKPPLSDSGDGEIRTVESAAEGYADLSPTPEDRDLFCASRNENCLERVREDLDAFVELVERNRKLLDRVERLHEYDHVHTLLPYRMDTPLPTYQSASLLRTRHAVRFARGETQEAIADTCRTIATWRRLGAFSDTLITRLVGAAYATRLYGQTLANMLSERPVDEPLPEACDDALAPPTLEDLSICNAVRGEYGMMVNATREFPQSVGENAYMDRLAWALLFDEEATLGMSAQALRTVCDQSERERLRTDRHQVPEAAHQDIWRFACIGNFIGCSMNAMARPGYDDYRLRLQDYGMKLRVLASLAWMWRHIDEERSPAELLAARPDELKSPAREITLGPDGTTLRIPLYDTARGEHWSIPLPPALHAAQ